MKKKISIFIIGILLLSGITIAQIPDIRFEKYTMQDGLTQNSTGPLLKDSHGFLWIGTGWGLNRYDGRVIKQYNKIGPNFLPDLHINSLAEDESGNIWIATANGLSCMNPYTEKFTNYMEGIGPGTIPYGFCYVYVDKQKNIWVADSYGISVFNKETKTFTTYPVTTAGKETRVNRYIDLFFEDSKGRFWVGTSYGIKLFDRLKKTYQSYHFEETDVESFSRNATQGIFEDKDGNIWAGTWNAGLLKLNPEKNIFENFHLTGRPFGFLNSVHDVNAITLNDHYYLLLATGTGLVLADPQKLRLGELPIEKIIEDPGDIDKHSLNGKSNILKDDHWKSNILKDDQNIYWISGLKELVKIDLSSQVFQWRILPDKSFSDATIFHIIPDIKEPLQKIFLTTTAGWWKYDLATRVFNKHILPKGFERLLEHINHFVTTENGYWFTSQLGVGFYNPTTNRVKDISSLATEKVDNQARTGLICKDNQGRIWFSAYRNGIRIYDPRSEKLISLFADSTQPDNLYGKSIFDMKQAFDGSIFLTSGEKVYHIDPENFSFTIMAPEKITRSSDERIGPRKILFDKKNRTLVLSQQRIYMIQNGKLLQLYPRSGFADFIMDNFLQDGNGDFWVTTNLGLFRTDTAFKEWANMSDKIFTGGVDDISEIFRTNNDEFVLASSGKIGVFSLHTLSKNNIAPAVIINRLRTGNAEQYLVSLKQQSRNVSFKDAIEIEVSAINFSNEKGNRVYYQLEGRDNDWKELTGYPVIRYDQLPPGNYTFKAKAMNGDAVWSKETILSFKVLPPFWRTWWFIGIVLIVIAALLYTVYRYRLTKAVELEKMRTRIATDLHDDIGATLSSISFYSEAVKQKAKEKIPEVAFILDKMGETSRSMVSSMSDIVWAINPANDDMGKMLNRMQSHAVELCVIKNVILLVDADEKIRHLKPHLEQRKNIYLIFKEALNNALKYSGCARIWLTLKHSNNLFSMQLKDDGKGFDSNKEFMGNGLLNMQRRAAEIDGTFTIASAANEGTIITLTVKIT